MIWIYFRIILLSERSQAQNRTCCMIWFKWNSRKGKLIHRDRKDITVVGTGVEGETAWALGHRKYSVNLLWKWFSGCIHWSELIKLPYVEALPPIWRLWRWCFWDVFRIRWGHEGRGPMWQDYCPNKKRHQTEFAWPLILPWFRTQARQPSTSPHQRWPCWPLQPRPLASTTARNKFLLFKSHSPLHFVVESGAN